MKTPRCKIVVAVFFILFAAGSITAGDAGRESQFSIGSGVRALGMGGGFVGLADDASAIYWNQAALTLLDNQEINLMHVTLYEGSVYDVASFVYPHPKLGGFGISFMRLGTGDIMRREDWNEVGEFSYATWQLILGYGHKLEKGFSFGTGLKIVNQSLDRNSTYGVGLDISFYDRISKNISAGISFQDIIAPRLRLGSALEITPTTVVAGIGTKDVRLGKGLLHNIGLGLEKGENRSLKLHLGAESIYRDYLSLRAGYDRDNLTFGLGIIYQKLRFDYAYKFMDELSDSHRLGLSIRLGTSVSEKIRREKEFENARGSSLILEDHKQSFRFFKELADKYYHNNSLDSAYAYYQRALAFNESDREARHRVSQIDELRKSALAEKEAKSRPQADVTQQLLEGYYSQAELFFNKGSFAAALDIIDLGLGRSPDNQKFLALKDQVTAGRDLEIGKMMDEAARAERDGRYADALTAYNRVMELSPGNVAVKQLIAKDGTELNKLMLINKGAELFASGLYSDAKGRFDEVLKIDPQNKVARDYAGRITLLMKESTELQDLQKDEKVWKIYLSALEYFRKEDYANAIKLWEEVLKYYPGNKNTMNNIEQAKLRLESK
jgi:tetratricopeptide (TPR) repeat protein